MNLPEQKLLNAPTAESSLKGRLFDIQKFSVNDGPGIRTLVFLKGCPLRCLWCANPEGQSPEAQILFYEERCDGCMRCFNGDRSSSHEKQDVGNMTGQRADVMRAQLQKAFASGKLSIKDCPQDAIKLAGFEKNVAELTTILVEDMPFCTNSGGGITLSGGEPLMQPEFSLAILRECERLGLRTTLETCGLAQWNAFEPLLEYLDLILFDLKHMDACRHEDMTGASNNQILSNLSRLLAGKTPVVVRIPLLPGFNDTQANILTTASFLSEFGRPSSLQRVELLPYHRLGVHKYRRLGLPYFLDYLSPPDEQSVANALKVFKSFDINCSVEYM